MLTAHQANYTFRKEPSRHRLFIVKQFRVDKADIPADKLNDPRLIDAEASINLELADETYRLQVCLHEAAHAVYTERAGIKCILLGPSIQYDEEDDCFHKTHASVANPHDTGPVLLSQWARWHVAGGVVMRQLTNRDDGGDESDKEDFFSEGKEDGIPEHEIQKLWHQAQEDVEKDLRSPAFRHQLWDRAREFKTEFDSKYKYVETPPEYFVVALDPDDAKETLDGNGKQIGVSFSFRVLEVQRGRRLDTGLADAA